MFSVVIVYLLTTRIFKKLLYLGIESNIKRKENLYRATTNFSHKFVAASAIIGLDA